MDAYTYIRRFVYTSIAEEWSTPNNRSWGQWRRHAQWCQNHSPVVSPHIWLQRCHIYIYICGYPYMHAYTYIRRFVYASIAEGWRTPNNHSWGQWGRSPQRCRNHSPDSPFLPQIHPAAKRAPSPPTLQRRFPTPSLICSRKTQRLPTIRAGCNPPSLLKPSHAPKKIKN